MLWFIAVAFTGSQLRYAQGTEPFSLQRRVAPEKTFLPRGVGAASVMDTERRSLAVGYDVDFHHRRAEDTVVGLG